MLDKDLIMDSLRRVEDPEIHKSLVELDMIKGIEISGDRVVVVVNLTIKGCPMKSKIREDIVYEVGKLEGVDEVEVVFDAMSEEEKRKLREKLYGTQKELFKGIPVIAIGSGKGGVGKSTITANLAVTLGKMGHRVGLLDGDILGFSIARILGIAHKKAQLLSKNTLLPVEEYGIKIISMGNLVEEDEAVVWRGPVLGKLLDQFFNDVYWGEIDFLLIDLPPGTGDVPLTIMQKIPNSKFVVVTSPQPSAARVAGRLWTMSQKAGIEVVGIIENMSHFVCQNCGEIHYIFGKGEGERLSLKTGTELIGEIPLKKEIRMTSDEGRPIVVEDADTFELYKSIAERLVRKVRG
ncbi:MAG: Mrp/NBP35 family ATP-binding protein [Bacillota bacterium]|nr:Mrp/NBP35 family ATP-binding protein [Bacillota bacterium]